MSITTLETACKPTSQPQPKLQPAPQPKLQPKLQPQPQRQYRFDPSSPFTQMHMRKPRPKTKPAPPAKKVVSSRPAHESPWAKTTPHKKRWTRPTPAPIGPRTCHWAGCGMRVGDGRAIWKHIAEEHNSGRPVRVGVKVKVYKGERGGRGMARVEVPLKRVIDEDYDGPELEEGEIMDVDREDDSLEDGELAIEAEEEKEKAAEEEESDEEVVVEVEKVSSKSKTEQWFDRIECLWEDCGKEIQFIGLRRHIETKHIPLRGAFCPNGCGKHVARSDMLWRHVEKCNN